MREVSLVGVSQSEVGSNSNSNMGARFHIYGLASAVHRGTSSNRDRPIMSHHLKHTEATSDRGSALSSTLAPGPSAFPRAQHSLDEHGVLCVEEFLRTQVPQLLLGVPALLLRAGFVQREDSRQCGRGGRGEG